MSRRYRLAFLETICHSKSSRNYSSYRQTNGGTSYLNKRKHSSLKGSLKTGYGNIRNEGVMKQRPETLPYRCMNRIQMCTLIDRGETVGRSNELKAVCNTANESLNIGAEGNRENSAYVQKHPGCFNQQEIILAEKKHVSKCAQNDHATEHAHFKCTNLVDIPALDLDEDACPIYSKDNSYDVGDNTNGSATVQRHTEKSDNNCHNTDNVDHSKYIVSSQNGKKNDEHGVFV